MVSKTALQDVKFTWNGGGNITQRQDIVSSETENFSYDFLDRLTGVSGAYTASYSYNPLGNITAMNGTSYTYGSQPHAVTSVGTTSYTYDSNGNMTNRGGQSITWNVDNQPSSIGSGPSATFVYNGDGNRALKTEGGQTILYVNKYYEKNITTGVVTTYYFLGGQLIANRTGSTLDFMSQDQISSTSVVTDSSGNLVSSIRYSPFGTTRSGSVPTAIEFTGQRLDSSTGLYYYNARYYDPTIGRFVSPDSVGQKLNDPQSLNRYSYVENNPLKYNDPTGHFLNFLVGAFIGAASYTITHAVVNLATGHSWNANWSWTEFAANAVIGAVTVGIAGELAAAKTGATAIKDTASLGRTFYSGPGAESAAKSFALQKGGTTILDTAEGQANNIIYAEQGYQAARPPIVAASQEFAQGASGPVHVFQGTKVATESVWATVEYPALVNNPNVTDIIYHVVDLKGHILWE
jgi:RHS repeat-associated protein